MKFSEQWLREWVDLDVSTEELAEQLTMAGLEVDAIEPVAAEFSGVVVGRVVKIEPHPQADRLQVCLVDIGTESPLTIVCGAKNVAVAMWVATACIGARLPGGMKIKKTKLRGVTSQGMLCSAAELGLSESAEGLLALDNTAPLGVDIRQVLLLDDVSIELGITPNRSDCLSLAGIAREAAVLNRCQVQSPEIAVVVVTGAATVPLRVEASAACPRYLGRVIEGIDNSIHSPLWLQERLRRSGLRSISAVVDVCNYVMLELGQPMHAFDRDKLQGTVTIRMAQPEEELVLLDEQKIVLNEQSLVIADEQGPLALAGIMGGLHSAVSDKSTAIFLESAFFNPAIMSGKARSYGLHTDSSHRFERGVDPELPRLAMDRATALLLSIVGGQASEIIEVVAAQHLPERNKVVLRAARLQRVLGLAIAAAEVTRILQSLGMEIIEQTDQQWTIAPPSFRFDIAIEADLIEEVARIHGYSQLPVSQPLASMGIQAKQGVQIHFDQQLAALLVARDYQEAINYSFVPAKLQSLLDPEHPGIALANPLSADLAIMRTSLWPGLIQSLQYNLNRQHKRVRLFETGVRFIRNADNSITEDKMIAAIVCGSLHAEQWAITSTPVDFYDIKADVETLLALPRNQDDQPTATAVKFVAAQHPALHPGQTAKIIAEDGALIGWCGLLHPTVISACSLEMDCYVLELSIAAMQKRGKALFQAISAYPAIRRDLAIIVDEHITAQQIKECITVSCGALLREMIIFDVYTGKGIDLGAKSLAIGLTLQEFSRTLTDNEVEALISRVLSELHETLGATLRE